MTAEKKINTCGKIKCRLMAKESLFPAVTTTERFVYLCMYTYMCVLWFWIVLKSPFNFYILYIHFTWNLKLKILNINKEEWITPIWKFYFYFTFCLACFGHIYCCRALTWTYSRVFTFTESQFDFRFLVSSDPRPGLHCVTPPPCG